MSLVPQTNLAIQPAPRGALWLSLDAAAERLRKSVGHTARLCRSEWVAKGVAVLRAPEGGGKPVWVVREDAHPLLSRAVAPEHLACDVTTLTAAQREELDRRVRIVGEWEFALAEGQKAGRTEAFVTADFLDHLLGVEKLQTSRATLFEWRAAFRRQGKSGLIDGRWKGSGVGVQGSDSLFLEELKRWYLDQNQPSAALCYRLTAAVARKNGWSIPHVRTARRWLAKIPRAKVVLGRLGKEAMNNLCAPFHERDYTGLASNQIWCADHHPCDTIVSHQGKLLRPWMTVFQDMRSRRIVGVVIRAEDPNRNAIILALKAGCLAVGVPQKVYFDNGKDFDCFALTGITKEERRTLNREAGSMRIDGESHVEVVKRLVSVKHPRDVARSILGGMGIEVMHAPPYRPQAKPVERFFGTFEREFGKLQRTYCGAKPEDKPEHLVERLEQGEAPTLEDYAAGAIEWIEREYHERVHEGQGMDEPPRVVFARCLTTKRITTTGELDFLLTEPSRPLKVGRNGVKLGGRTYGQGEPLLMGEWLNKSVILRVDPLDVTRAFVCTVEGRSICKVSMNRLVPFAATEEEFREAHRQISKAKKVQKEAIATRHLRMTVDPSELIYANRAAEAKRKIEESGPEPTPEPPSIQPIRTAVTDQLKALQTANERREMRMAAGAEHDSFGAMGDALANVGRHHNSSGDPDDDESIGGDPFAQLSSAMSLRLTSGDDE